MTTTAPTKTIEYSFEVAIGTTANVHFTGPEGLTPDQVFEYLCDNGWNPVSEIDINPTLQRGVWESLSAGDEFDLCKSDEDGETYEYNPDTETWVEV